MKELFEYYVASLYGKRHISLSEEPKVYWKKDNGTFSRLIQRSNGSCSDILAHKVDFQSLIMMSPRRQEGGRRWL